MLSRTLRSLCTQTAKQARPAASAKALQAEVKPNSAIARDLLQHSHVDDFTLNVVRPYLYRIIDWCDSLQFFEVKESDMLCMHRKRKTPEMARTLEQLPGSRGFPIFVLARYEKTARALRIDPKDAHIIMSILGTQWNLLPEDVQAKINFGSVKRVMKLLRDL